VTQQQPSGKELLAGRQVFTAQAPRIVWALLTLGYDLFCRQTKNAPPGYFVDRLRTNRSFQAARYKVATGAIMARAGYDVHFLDEETKDEKHCEFLLATVCCSSGLAVLLVDSDRRRSFLPALDRIRGLSCGAFLGVGSRTS